MRALAVLCLAIAWPIIVIGQTSGTARHSSDRTQARNALRQKLAEAEKLRVEIQRLRELAGEPSASVRVRVRILDVSLSKAENMGLEWLVKFGSNAEEVDRQVSLLIGKRLAKMRADELVIAPEGTKGHVREGEKLFTDPTRELATKNDGGHF